MSEITAHGNHGLKIVTPEPLAGEGGQLLNDNAKATETALDTLDAHAASTSNPHSVTATQVGAPPTTRTISTTAPLSGGGDLSANRTLSITAATSGAAGSMSATDKTKLDNATSSATPDTLVIRDGDGGAAFDDVTAQSVTAPTINTGNIQTADDLTITGGGGVTIDSNLTITGSLTGVSAADVGAAASSHTHAQSDVTNLVSDLAGKASTSHTHAQSDVTSLTSDLAAKTPTSRTISTTAPLTGGGDLSANRTLAISAATTGAAGSMSAADKTKLDAITVANLALLNAANVYSANQRINGRLGINTDANATYLIDAYKASGLAYLRLESGDSGCSIDLTGTYGQISSGGDFYFTTSNNLIFRTNGGDEKLRIAPTTGLATFQGSIVGLQRLTTAVVALTDGATPALDASLGNTFTLSASGNRTIAVPSNPTNGQKLLILHYANGADRTLSLNTGAGGFKFGANITGLTATTSGTIDAIGAIYTTLGSLNKWIVVAYEKGY